jgi:cation diffusion facilitator CzcD-associated flavoprotein CzcO
MHSQAYHDYKGHEGQRVVVIGIGNSALDVAVELAGHSKSVSVFTLTSASMSGSNWCSCV